MKSVRLTVLALVVLLGSCGETKKEAGRVVTLRGKVNFPTAGHILIKEMQQGQADGGNGFQDTIVLKSASPDDHPRICQALPELKPVSLSFEQQGTKIIYIEESGSD